MVNITMRFIPWKHSCGSETCTTEDMYTGRDDNKSQGTGWGKILSLSKIMMKYEDFRYEHTVVSI
jgi:hypothetical protein